jgi:hypothetical protein
MKNHERNLKEKERRTKSKVRENQSSSRRIKINTKGHNSVCEG